MSERLTDEELAEFEKSLQVHRDVIHPDVLGRATFTTRVTFKQMESLLAELRELRAAQVAMTEPGTEALLRDIADVVRDSDIMQWDSAGHRGRAVALLSMLIGQVAK